MWLLVLSVPLLSVVVVVSNRYRVKVTALCRGAVGWVLRLTRGAVCVRRTHAFVFSECTHGNTDSVLETFDLYADTHPSFALGPQRGQVLDEVVRRVKPQRVLELGTHCGYCSIRMLRLLPPAGRLVTVEVDPYTADLGEELILVAGFKHSQFQVLTSSSAEAIPALRPRLEPEHGAGTGLDLVLMDHDPQQYLPDLLALEREGLLCSSGCCVLLINRGEGPAALRDVQEHLGARPDCYSVKTELRFMMEVFYQKDG
ncbi:transmembrane O-methyltransferase homolog [Polymixia lowei]